MFDLLYVKHKSSGRNYIALRGTHSEIVLGTCNKKGFSNVKFSSLEQEFVFFNDQSKFAFKGQKSFVVHPHGAMKKVTQYAMATIFPKRITEFTKTFPMEITQ